MRSRAVLTTLGLTIGLGAGVVTAAEPGDPVVGAPVPMERAKQGEKLVRHTGEYEPLQLRWALNDRVAGVLAVLPHPQIASEIYLATEAGLFKSADAGQSFTALTECAADKIGTVTAIAFRPDAPARFVIATQDRGLFSTSDSGKTVTQLATKSTGLASDTVVGVYYASDDNLFRTLIAVHGIEAPGLSRSTNGGKSWEVLFPQQHVHQVFWPRAGEKQVLLDGSPPEDIDRHTLYFLASIQEPWQKLVSDVLITGAASPRSRGDTIYLATADQGVYRVAREGGVIVSTTPAGESEWSSLGITSNPTADHDFFYAYHAKKLGMVLFTPKQLAGTVPPGEDAAAAEAPKSEGPAFRTLSDGLFTGPLVLEGAHIRAGANGNSFYAVVNRTLYQSVLTTTGLSVAEVSVTPSTIYVEPDKLRSVVDPLHKDLLDFADSDRTRKAAAELAPKLAEHRKILDLRRFVVSARVKSAATDPATSVTVDLSRLSKSAFAPLYDDGKHHDGAAGDGVYANAFDLDFGAIRRYNEDWRAVYPGPIALTVSAVSQSKALSGAVATLSLYPRRDSVAFVTDAKPNKISGAVVGGLTRGPAPKREYVQVIGIKSPGPWAVAISNWRNSVSINREQVLSFYIRSSQPIADSVSLQLRDGPAYQRPNVTPKIDLMAEGFIPNPLTPTEQRVLIPVTRLLEGAEEFQASITVGMIVSGDAKQAGDILLRDIKLIPVSAVTESETEAP